MPSFRYEGVSKLGDTERGEIVAPDEQRAYQALLANGITATSLADATVAESATPWYLRDVQLFSRGMSLNEQVDVAGQMAALFKAKLPLSEILSIMSRSASSKRMRFRFDRIRLLVADGEPLATAFARANPGASSLFTSILNLADIAPDPGKEIATLATFLRKQQQTTRQMSGALIYPAILIATAIAVFIVVAVFLAPNLAPMFRSLNRPVPFALALFDAVGEFILGHTAIIFIAGVLAITVAAFALAASEVRAWLSVALGRLPLIGTLMRQAELARLTNCLAMLIDAGLPIATSFRQAAQAVGGNDFSELYERCATAVEHGEPISEQLAKEAKVPISYLELFRVAESSNTLSEILPLLAADLDSRTDQTTARLLLLMTPVLTLFIGGGIATLAYSVMSAILSVNDLAL